MEIIAYHAKDLAQELMCRCALFLDGDFRDGDQFEAYAGKVFASRAAEDFGKFKTV